MLVTLISLISAHLAYIWSGHSIELLLIVLLINNLHLLTASFVQSTGFIFYIHVNPHSSIVCLLVISPLTLSKLQSHFPLLNFPKSSTYIAFNNHLLIEFGHLLSLGGWAQCSLIKAVQVGMQFDNLRGRP